MSDKQREVLTFAKVVIKALYDGAEIDMFELSDMAKQCVDAIEDALAESEWPMNRPDKAITHISNCAYRCCRVEASLTVSWIGHLESIIKTGLEWQPMNNLPKTGNEYLLVRGQNTDGKEPFYHIVLCAAYLRDHKENFLQWRRII